MKKVISRLLYQHPKDFMNWLKGRKEKKAMEVTIDTITMQRINLDVNDVKEAIKHYVASRITPPITDIDKATVKLHSNGALVEIIINSVPDMPDIAPPCIEIPSNGTSSGGAIHPDQMMKNLEESFVPEKED